MAIKFKQSFVNTAQMVDSYAKLNKYYSAKSMEGLGESDTYTLKSMLADTINKDVSSFDRDKYDTLTKQDKVAYYYNEYYQDRNETETDDQGNTVNVYEQRKKYLDAAYQDAKARENYESLNIIGKFFTNVGGLLGNVVSTIYDIGENIIDATWLLAGGIASVVGDKDSARSIKERLAKDTTGARAFKESLNKYLRNYTEADNDILFKTTNEVAGAIAAMVPMMIPGIGPAGTFLYYTSMSGGTGNEILQNNTDIDYGRLFAYVAGTTAIEMATEAISAKMFPDTPNPIDIMTGAAKKGTSKAVAGSMWRNTLKTIGLNMASEGLEEAVSEIFGGILYNQLIDSNSEPFSIKDILNAAVIGALTGGVMTGGQVATSTRYAVDSSGELRRVKDIKKTAQETGVKTKDLINKKISKMTSYSLLPALDAITNTTNATNVYSLMTKTGLSENELATSTKYEAEYKEALEKDTKNKRAREKSALYLAKYMESIGVKAFENATKLLENSMSKAKMLVDNYNNMRSGVTARDAKYAKAFSEINEGAKIEINNNPSDAFKVIAKKIKQEYGVDLIAGKVGQIDGNNVPPITSIHGAMLVDENILQTMSPQELFEKVIKQKLVESALTENLWLDNKTLSKILKIVMPENIDIKEGVVPDDVKQTLAQQLLFDDISIEKIFLQNTNIFTRFGRWVVNSINKLRGKTSSEAKKIQFRTLLKTRDKYIKAVAKNIGNNRDAEKTSKIFELTRDEFAEKLIGVMKADEFNKHISLYDTNLSTQTIRKVNATRYFKSMMLDSAFNADGSINWDAAQKPENYKPEVVKSLMKKHKETSFIRAVESEIYVTQKMYVSFTNRAIFNPVDLKKLETKGFVSTVQGVANEEVDPNKLKKYNTIQSVLGDSVLEMYDQEDLDRVHIIYENDLKTQGYIEFKPSKIGQPGDIIIHVNLSTPNTIETTVLHEINHAFAYFQGLPEGTSYAETTRVIDNTPSWMLKRLLKAMFPEEILNTMSFEEAKKAAAYSLYYQSYGELYARGDVRGFLGEDGFLILNGKIYGIGKYTGFVGEIRPGMADMAVEKVDSAEDTETITRIKADGTVVTETVKKSTGKGDSKEKKTATPTVIRQSLERKYNKNAESMRQAGYSTEFINDFLDSSIDKPVTFYTDKIDDAVGKIATTNEDLRNLQSGKPISIYDEKSKKRISKPWSELTEEQQNAEKARISRQAGNNQIGSVDAINDLISICYPNNQNIKDITSILREITGASTGSGEKTGMVFSEGSVMKTGVSPLILALTYYKLKSTIVTGDFSWLESVLAPTTLKKDEDLAKALKREGFEDSEIKLMVEQYEADVREAKQNIKKLFEEYKNIFESENKDMKLTVPHMVSVLLGDVNFENKTYKLNEDKYNAVAPLLLYINTLLQDKQNPKRELIKKLLSEDFSRTYETSKKMFAALRKGLLYELSVGEGAVKGKKGKGETSFIERASSDEDVAFEDSDTEDTLSETEESVDYDEDSAFEALLKSEDLENRKKGFKKTSFGEDKMIEAISKNSQKVTEWLEGSQKENVGIGKYFSNVLGFKAALNRKDVSEAVKEEIRTQASLDEFVRVIDEYIDNIDVSQPGAEDLFYNIYTKLDAQRNNIAVAFGKTAWDDVVKHHVPNQRRKGYNYSAKELLDKVHNKRKGDVRKTIKETAPKSKESVIESQPKTNTNKEKIVEKKPVEEKTQETNMSENDTDSAGNKLSKEQQEFFKDSKIRDKRGRLLKLYHGSPASDIISFEFSDDAPNNFFTTSKPYAEQYINDIDTGEPDGKVYEVYLNIKNPFNATDPKNAELAEKILGRVPTTRTVSDTDKIYKYLRENETEFDGIVAGEELSDKMIDKYGKNANTSFVPLYPEQIKLVENTNPKNSDSIHDDSNKEYQKKNKQEAIESNEKKLEQTEPKTEKVVEESVVKTEPKVKKERTAAVEKSQKTEKKYDARQQRIIDGIKSTQYRTDPESILYVAETSRDKGYSEEADKEYGVRSFFDFEATKENILADIRNEEDIELVLNAIENNEIPPFEAAAFLNWLAIKEYIFVTNEALIEKYDRLRKEYISVSASILVANRWALAPHTHLSSTVSEVSRETGEKFTLSDEYIDKHLPELKDAEGRIKELESEIAELRKQLDAEKDAYNKYVKEQELKQKEIEMKLVQQNDVIGLVEHKAKQLEDTDTNQTENLAEIAEMYGDAAKELALFAEKYKPLGFKEKAITRMESWRYMSMLSNPATWSRNAITNRLVSVNGIIVDMFGKSLYNLSERNRIEYVKKVGYYGDYDSSFKKLVEELFKEKLISEISGSKYDKSELDRTRTEYAKERAAQVKGKFLTKAENFLYEKALSDKRWLVPRAIRNLTNAIAGSRELLLSEVIAILSTKYKVPMNPKALDPTELIKKIKQTNPELAQRLTDALNGNLNETLLLSKEMSPKEGGILSQIVHDSIYRSNELLFKVNTKLSDAINKFGKNHPAARLLISAVMPFVRSSINIGWYALKFGPGGIIMGFNRMRKWKANVYNDMRKELSEAYRNKYKKAKEALAELEAKEIENKNAEISAQIKQLKQEILELQKQLTSEKDALVKEQIERTIRQKQREIKDLPKKEAFKKVDSEVESYNTWLKNNVDQQTYDAILGNNKHIKEVYEQAKKDDLVHGLTIGLSDLFGQAKALELISTGAVGTGAIILGIIFNALFNVFDIDDDEDYLGPIIKLGPLKISLDSLSPASAGFTIGALLVSDRANKFDDMWEILVNQTLFSTFESAMKYNDGSLGWAQNQLINYVQQYIPGILKPITKIIDNSKKDKSGNFMWKLLKTTGSNIPGLSYLVGNKINPYTGETEKYFYSWWDTLLGAYSPITFRFKPKTELEKLAEKYDAETKGLTGKFTYNGVDYNVSDKHRESLARYRANYINKEYEAISSGKKLVTVEDENGKRVTTKWSKLTEKQKATVLKRLYSDASDTAKVKYWTVDLGNVYKTGNKTEYLKYKQLFSSNIQYSESWEKSKFVVR